MYKLLSFNLIIY